MYVCIYVCMYSSTVTTQDRWYILVYVYDVCSSLQFFLNVCMYVCMYYVCMYVAEPGRWGGDGAAELVHQQ